MTNSEVTSYVNSAIFAAGIIYLVSKGIRRHAIKKALKFESKKRSDSSLQQIYDTMNNIFPKTHPEDAPYGPEQSKYNREFKKIVKHSF